MMGRALLVVGLVATLGFAASAVLGYGTDPAAESLRLHVLVALASVLLLLFSHCWIMFYLIGTGKAIKEAVAEHGLDAAAVEETKRFKNESYPALMLAIGLAMATFILGGGASTGALPPLLHHVLFYLTLAAQGRALLAEKRVLDANERLMAELDRTLAARLAT